MRSVADARCFGHSAFALRDAELRSFAAKNSQTVENDRETWHTFYKVRPRKDHRAVDLISDALPFGRLWYGEPNAITNAIGYAKFFSRSHDAVIRVYDETGNVIVIVAGFVGTEYRT